MILCSNYQINYSETENPEFNEFFNSMENIVSVFNGTIIRVPSLHGPSLRMRWDTTVNQIFLMLYLNRQCILESEWLTPIPFAGVLDLSQYIVNDILNGKKGGLTINYFTEKLNTLNLAHIIKCAIEEEQPEIDDMVIDTRNSKEISNLRFFNDPMNCSQPVRKSVADIITNLKKNALPNFLTDTFNNANMIGLAGIYKNFINEVGEE